jgi:ubiquinol-cytochrome c reductase cytochrome b subunit
MSRIASAVTTWLEERLGLRTLMSRLLSGQVDPRWAWLRTSGMICLVLVLVECVSGPILGLYYTPSPASAYKDIVALEQNPFGRFLRGLHHWSSAALILLALFTVARMFFGAEYKGRRDVVWIVALLFLQFVIFFQLTGHMLTWDTNAVATTSVEAGIANNVWVVGPTIKRFLLGGGTTGAATLTRWYGIHALLLPLVTLLVCGLPLLLHRLHSGEDGVAATDETDGVPAVRKLEHYYPNHMAREMFAALAVFCVITVMAWSTKTPLENEATADNLSGYTAMSEWYVLPVHAATLFPPFNQTAFEPIVTAVLPGILFTVLLLLPFIDRNPYRRASKRRFAVAAGTLTVVSTLGLYAYAYVKERPMIEAARVKVGESGAAQVVVDTKLVELGKQMYAKQNCNACHAIAGEGAKSGPDLTKAGVLHADRDWQIKHLVKPDSMVPGSTMPAYGHLKKDEIAAMAEYMISLR